MKKSKQILAVLLCAAMMLAFVPVISVSASEYSGTCGTNVTWTLDTDTGILTISGTGAMKNYTTYSKVPWYKYATNITSIEILDSVTSIGSYAFYGCTSLTGISIPNNVTSIGKNAFRSCTSLTSITIPNSVTSIGNGAFAGCKSLTSITIPNSVTSIGDSAFSGCTSLTSISIPNSVTSIGNSAFSGCTSLTSITIPDSVISIGSFAFEYCTSLASINIPNSVTSIGSYAFYGTTYYNDSANWTNGVLYIDNHLIKANSNSTSGSYKIRSGTLTIADSAFYDYTSLASITIPDSVTSIGSEAFRNCTSLTNVSIPDSVTSIGEVAFYNCTSLTSINIPNSVASIGNNAFFLCTALTDVYYGGSEEDWANISIGSNNTCLTNATIHYNSTTPITEQSSEITVTLNGSVIEFDQPPVIVNGRTLVPLRAIFEALGANVEWNGETQSVTAEKDGTIVILTVGQTTMYVNGKAKTLDAAPQLINNRTLVPARAIAEAFGCSVDWDNETRTVVITQ